MFAGLRRHWRARRERLALARRAIPDPLWQATLEGYPFLARLPAEDLVELRRLSSLFLDRKEFSGAHGLAVSDEMAVAVAAQACLPVLRLGLDLYRGFVGIVIHPDQVKARRERIDDDGVVHRYVEVLSGEAMDGGPVMLSWHDVRSAGESAGWAYNVVIHEFAHVIDMVDGLSDGIPPIGPTERRRWSATLEREFDRLRRWVDADVPTVLDPYGAEGPDEFFAVATEAFFVAGADLREQQPELYGLLSGYFRQDPAGR